MQVFLILILTLCKVSYPSIGSVLCLVRDEIRFGRGIRSASTRISRDEQGYMIPMSAPRGEKQ